MRERALKFTVLLAALAATGQARAASDLTGVWIDHTGRGAVEITACGANLCGHLVWVKDGANKQGCGMQIIGNVKPVGKDTWDGGWIYDPDRKEKYSVELKPVGADKMRVLGYMGSKMFSETMVWKRAAADLKRCNDVEPAAAPLPSEKKTEAPPSGNAASKAPVVEPVKPAPKGTGPKGKSARQPEKTTDCKKYFPQIGEMVSVPCPR
jgi:uncharacterized protein (DUF2147 family)